MHLLIFRFASKAETFTEVPYLNRAAGYVWREFTNLEAL